MTPGRLGPLASVTDSESALQVSFQATLMEAVSHLRLPFRKYLSSLYRVDLKLASTAMVYLINTLDYRIGV